MTAPVTIVWLRSDLRLADNPALHAAADRGGPVIPVFVWSPEEEGAAAPGAARRWWLHQSLAALDHSLRARGLRLILSRGPALEALLRLARITGATAMVWNRRYEPSVAARDQAVDAGLRAAGIATQVSSSALLFEPEQVSSAAGAPFLVFSAFWRACRGRPAPAPPLRIPSRLHPPARWPASLPLRALALEPEIDWAGGIAAAWTPGEAGAQQALRRFVARALDGYHQGRELPATAGTSRLSPHLCHGELGPRQIWEAVQRGGGGEQYLRELGWREFAYHLLHHFPHTVDEPLRPAYARFAWVDAPAQLRAWQRGRTGYPLVDAGMRELWTTGWMHNRVRMVAASFLVKDLLIRWQQGARWFWDTLVDADLASNTLGWQWVAGSGADAAPYFRIFNPLTQREKFDPDERYVRRWVPELGTDRYPPPIVDHAWARERALAARAEVAAGGAG
jgi:deoxyribodipyrimidine photo-lyase